MLTLKRFSQMHNIGRSIPFLLSILAFVLLCIYADDMFGEDNTIEWSNLYAAIFDWAAIQTGFLFGVYGFVVGSPKGFINAIRGTKPFRFFTTGIITSLCVGFALTIISLPLLVFSPDPINSSKLVTLLIYLWFSLFIFALITFFRAAYLFAYMTRQKAPDTIRG